MFFFATHDACNCASSFAFMISSHAHTHTQTQREDKKEELKRRKGDAGEDGQRAMVEEEYNHEVGEFVFL